MPKAGNSLYASREIQSLEDKLNKLRWINNDLNRQVFDASQRGHRLANKLGYQNLEEAEAALATQVAEHGQSQFEQLSQHPAEELASHVQELQSELLSHVNLGKKTLDALNEAVEEMSALREQNLALRAELESLSAKEKEEAASAANPTEVEYLREELAALHKQYTELQEAKQRSDHQHGEDFRRWKRFRDWILGEERKEKEEKAEEDEPAVKRRKVSPQDESDDKENFDTMSPDLLPDVERERRFGGIKRRLQEKRKKSRLGRDTPGRAGSPAPKKPRKQTAVLTSRNLNSSSDTPPLPVSVASTSKLAQTPARVLKRERSGSVAIPPLDVHASSETEQESQPVAYLFPSQLDVTVPSTIPRKRPRSPVHDSSETELESQDPGFLYASQIVPEPSARATEMTPKPQPALGRAAQLPTPVSVARPLQLFKGKGKGKENSRSSSEGAAPPSSSSASASSDPFRPLRASAAPQDVKPVLPETPVSLASKKGKERFDPGSGENDENAAPSTSGEKNRPTDYSVFKGRGRYGEELRAGQETINALYELDPERNSGVGFQFEEVVRDKRQRKHMHAVDCECCRDYYEAVGPLPPRAQAPLWRSPESTPSKPPRGDGDSFGGDVAAAAIEEHKQAISRHRQHWPRAKTPPGYWNIGFPDTQEVAAMNAEAARMHAQKREMVAQEARRGGRFKRR